MSASTKCAAWRRLRWPIVWCSITLRSSKAGMAVASLRRCSNPSPRSNVGCRKPWPRTDRTHGGAGRRVRPLIAIMALLLLAPAVARAAGIYRSVEIEGLRIAMDAEWGSQLAPGYLPVRFDISNVSTARVIEVVVESNRFPLRGYTAFRGPRGFSPSTTTVVQTVRLARGDRVRFTLP